MSDKADNGTATAAPSATTAESKLETKTRLKEAYERIVQRVGHELKGARNVGKKQWEESVKSAREFVKRAKPDIKREDVDKVGETVKKDVRNVVGSLKARGKGITQSQSFLTARDKGAQFLLKIAHKLKDAAVKVESNLEESLKYHQGEFAGAGVFACTSCNKELALKEAGTIPACGCGKGDFKRKG
jgi:rubrerythrin